MILLPDFRISRNPYAVAPDTLRKDNGERWILDAVWFRHRPRMSAGVRSTYPVACMGWVTGRSEFDTGPVDAADFMARWDTRYGGETLAVWDGVGLWVAHKLVPKEMEVTVAPLRRMLEAYPNVPDGYVGWWSRA